MACFFSEDDDSITLRSATETVVLPKDEIDERTLSDTSMMPDDQLKQYSPQQFVSLIAYLQGKSQTWQIQKAKACSTRTISLMCFPH